MTTWRYEGGPLNGRRIWLTRGACAWRSRTGTPAMTNWIRPDRYYRADPSTRVYRAVGEQ